MTRAHAKDLTAAERLEVVLEELFDEHPEHEHAAVLMRWYAERRIDAEIYCAAVEALEDADAAPVEVWS
jgi:hypothetical protein